MSDERPRSCLDCGLEWRGPDLCWTCGPVGDVRVRTYFSGATYRVADVERDLAEPAPVGPVAAWAKRTRGNG